MRCPAPRVLLVVFLAVALLAGAGVASGDAPVQPAELTTSADTSVSSAADTSVSSAADTSVSSAADTSTVGSVGGAVAMAVAKPGIDDGGPVAPALDGAPNRAQVAAFDRPPETDISVDLRPNRNAHWEVVVRYEFTDANETAVFETVSDRYLEEELGPSATQFENFADGASRNADREMAIEAVDRSVAVHHDTGAFDVDDEVVAVGELRLTFVWTAFLEEDGDDLVLGDALTTPTNDTWLRSLSDGQSIEVMTPAGYSVSGTPGATLPLRDNAVVIEGPRAFDDEERVAVVYSPTATAETPPWTLLAGAIVLAALVIALGLLAYRRVGSDRAANGPPVSGSPNGPGGPSASAAEDGGASAGDDADEEPEEDLSLLSDEERVERLLELNGGRMRQADIVSETGWSDAKVSQLLSTMADDGRVEKLRLGRENLISLPDDDGDTGSGSEDGDGDSGGGRGGDTPGADRGGEASSDDREDGSRFGSR
ncbi:helix-turn-helix transcriptional regulator [Halorubrum luteum]